MLRFGDKLPPAVILEATDRILDHAKEEIEAGLAMPVNFDSSHGSASFGSIYELRLFELLPVIQSLDPSKAEQLLRDNPKTKAVLERYPQGMRSLDNTITSTPRAKSERSDIFAISMGPVPEFDPQAAKRSADIEKQRKAIYELARRDPKQALESALDLPGHPESGRTPWSPLVASWVRGILQLRKRPSKRASNCQQNSTQCSGFKFSRMRRMLTCN